MIIEKQKCYVAPTENIVAGDRQGIVESVNKCILFVLGMNCQYWIGSVIVSIYKSGDRQEY